MGGQGWQSGAPVQPPPPPRPAAGAPRITARRVLGAVVGGALLVWAASSGTGGTRPGGSPLPDAAAIQPTPLASSMVPVQTPSAAVSPAALTPSPPPTPTPGATLEVVPCSVGSADRGCRLDYHITDAPTTGQPADFTVTVRNSGSRAYAGLLTMAMAVRFGSDYTMTQALPVTSCRPSCAWTVDRDGFYYARFQSSIAPGRTVKLTVRMGTPHFGYWYFDAALYRGSITGSSLVDPAVRARKVAEWSGIQVVVLTK